MARIGIFGGSFNPVHNGHLVVALEAQEAARLDRVLWIPAAEAPHKPNRRIADASLRIAWIRGAIDGISGMMVDDREIRRGGVSWSIVTIRELNDECRGDQLFFLIGADSVPQLPTWREADEICQRVVFVVTCRPGHPLDPENPPLPGFRAIEVPGTPIGISSTLVRARIQASAPIRGYVPEAVAESIAQSGAYVGA